LLLPKRTHPNIESEEVVVVVVVVVSLAESIFIVGSRGVGRDESKVLAGSTGVAAQGTLRAAGTGVALFTALLLLGVVVVVVMMALEPRAPETIKEIFISDFIFNWRVYCSNSEKLDRECAKVCVASRFDHDQS
jgi:hypothetical protein